MSQRWAREVLRRMENRQRYGSGGRSLLTWPESRAHTKRLRMLLWAKKVRHAA